MLSDLHVHSVHSDGSFYIGEIIDLAKHKGLECIAITDHDTVNGVPEAIEYGKSVGIKVIPAIELSADCGVPAHILGYNIDYNNPDFCAELLALRRLRLVRKDKILARLKKYNIFIDNDALPQDNVGRSHIAKGLKDAGYVSTIQEAFDKYLGEHKLAFVPSDRLTPIAAVQMIHKYGGQSVIAHPIKLYRTHKLELMIQGLIPYGLGGLECYYPTHSLQDTQLMLDIANKYSLFPSGGSDFHGVFKGQGNMLGICTCDLPRELQ